MDLVLCISSKLQLRARGRGSKKTKILRDSFMKFVPAVVGRNNFH